MDSVYIFNWEAKWFSSTKRSCFVYIYIDLKSIDPPEARLSFIRLLAKRFEHSLVAATRFV